jgi:uncharacterized protein YxeA
MKKVMILFTLLAFVTAGALTVNKAHAKVIKDMKTELVKSDQDPVKAKKEDKSKTTDKPAVAPSVNSAAGQQGAPAPNAPKSNVKPNYPKAKQEACDTGTTKPDKK